VAAEDHRAQAEKLREEARLTKSQFVREQLLLMAADWDKLADEAEEEERRAGPPPN
jgi:hypothetical protein